MEAGYDGEYVAIDVDSGHWAVAESELCRIGQSIGPVPERHRRLAASRGVQGGGQHRGPVSAAE